MGRWSDAVECRKLPQPRQREREKGLHCSPQCELSPTSPKMTRFGFRFRVDDCARVPSPTLYGITTARSASPPSQCTDHFHVPLHSDSKSLGPVRHWVVLQVPHAAQQRAMTRPYSSNRSARETNLPLEPRRRWSSVARSQVVEVDDGVTGAPVGTIGSVDRCMAGEHRPSTARCSSMVRPLDNPRRSMVNSTTSDGHPREPRAGKRLGSGHEESKRAEERNRGPRWWEGSCQECGAYQTRLEAAFIYLVGAQHRREDTAHVPHPRPKRARACVTRGHGFRREADHVGTLYQNPLTARGVACSGQACFAHAPRGRVCH